MTNKRAFIEKYCHSYSVDFNIMFDTLEKRLLEDIERDNLQIINSKDDETASYEMNPYGSLTSNGTKWRDGFMNGVKWLMLQQIEK